MELVKLHGKIERYGIIWTVNEVNARESDEGVFLWDEVKVSADGLNRCGEPRAERFFYNRRRVKDFNGNLLDNPVFI